MKGKTYKNRVPLPHPLTLFGYEKNQQFPIQSHSTALSYKALKNIKTKSVPQQETSYENTFVIRKVIQKRTIIKSNPEIKTILKDILQNKTHEIPKTTSSFFFANIIVPKKKLRDLYSKGYFIGNERANNENEKHYSSRSLSFINKYNPK